MLSGGSLGYVMGRTQYGGAVHAADSFDGNIPLGHRFPKFFFFFFFFFLL